jgi:hypothetical protein
MTIKSVSVLTVRERGKMTVAEETIDPGEFEGRRQAVTDALQSAANQLNGAINLSSYGILWSEDIDVTRIGELITEMRDALTTLKKTTGA